MCFNQSSNCKQHERTHTGERSYTCKHCKKSFTQLSNCKKREGTHTEAKVKPYTCKYCKRGFSQSSSCKRHEGKHAIDSSLKQNQRDQGFKLVRHFQEPRTTHGCKESGILFSSTEENSSQVESLTCWICQEEFSSEEFLIKHYDEHMA